MPQTAGDSSTFLLSEDAMPKTTVYDTTNYNSGRNHVLQWPDFSREKRDYFKLIFCGSGKLDMYTCFKFVQLE